jgi:RecA/RadA recombinase
MDAMIRCYDSEKPKQRFYIIDTEGGFNEERFKDIVRKRELEEDIINRLAYKRVASFGDQHKAVMEEIPNLIKQGYEPGLIAIDSFINWYHHRLCGIKREFMMVTAKELQGRLSIQMSKLFQLAEKYNCPIILTSWPKTTFGRRDIEARLSDTDLTRYYLHGMTIDLSMLGGKRLEFLGKVVVRVARLRLDASAAILLKHLERPTDYYTWFTITEKGIQDVPREDMREIKYITHLYEFMRKEAETLKKQIEAL